MQVRQKLAEIRNSAKGCKLLAYIDLGSEMVLACDATPKPAQEKLNDLATAASDVFHGKEAEQIVELLHWSSPLEEVVLSDKNGTAFWHATNAEREEAIVATGQATAQLLELQKVAHETIKLVRDV